MGWPTPINHQANNPNNFTQGNFREKDKTSSASSQVFVISEVGIYSYMIQAFITLFASCTSIIGKSNKFQMPNQSR